jgi:hypothetical protein
MRTSRTRHQAGQMDTGFAWQLVTGPGVRYSSRAMSRAATKVLLGDAAR